MSDKKPFEVISHPDQELHGVGVKVMDVTIVLRGKMSKAHAEALCVKLNKLLNVKLTRATCEYCHGIGGCHWCDS